MWNSLPFKIRASTRISRLHEEEEHGGLAIGVPLLTSPAQGFRREGMGIDAYWKLFESGDGSGSDEGLSAVFFRRG